MGARTMVEREAIVERRAAVRETPMIKFIEIPRRDGMKRFELIDVSDRAFAIDGVLGAAAGERITIKLAGSFLDARIIRKDDRRTVISVL